MEWVPVTGSWPARGKGPGAAGGRLMRQDRCFRKFLFFLFFLLDLWNILCAPAMRVATGNIPVLYRPAAKTRMGKGHEKVCGLCIYVVHGKWGLLAPSPGSPVSRFLPDLLGIMDTASSLSGILSHSASPGGKVHAVQVRHIDLIPVCHMIFFSSGVSTLDCVGFCCPSCKGRRVIGREGRRGGCEVAQGASVAPRPAPLWDQVDCGWAVTGPGGRALLPGSLGR